MRSTKQPINAQQSVLEAWLTDNAAKAYDAFLADSTRGRSSQDIRATLASAHVRAIKGISSP